MMGHQILRDQNSGSYSNFRVFKALNTKKAGNTIISQTMAASKFTLV